MFEQLETTTVDRVTLGIDRVAPRGASRGAVLCLHAMMTDGRYFGARRPDGFAHALAATGLEVYVADFRGHGRSLPPRAGTGDWSFDDLVELDLPAIIAAVPAGAAILGHSLGGLVACAALGTGRIPPPRALVLAATSVWLGETPARRAVMAAYRGVTALFGKAPIRALRAGTADESATYVEQLTAWSRTRRWTSLRGIDYLAALETITAPTHALVGAGDWMCRPADADRIARRIGGSTPLRVVGCAHEDPIDADHFELFTRPELSELRRWLATTLA